MRKYVASNLQEAASESNSSFTSYLITNALPPKRRDWSVLTGLVDRARRGTLHHNWYLLAAVDHETPIDKK